MGLSEDHIKSARQIHTLLIVATAILFAFSMSTNMEKRYQLAREELASLRELNWRQVAVNVDKALRGTRPPFGHPRIGDVPGGPWEQRLQEISEHWPKQLSVDGLFPLIVNTPRENQSLNAFRNAMTAGVVATRIIPTCPPKEVLDRLSDKLQSGGRNGVDPELIVEFQGWAPMLYRLSPVYEARDFDGPFVNARIDTTSIALKWQVDGGYMTVPVWQSQRTDTFRDWIPLARAVHSVNPRLVELSGGSSGVLPALSSVWTAVGAFSPIQADSVLAVRIEAASGQWQVLGVAVDSNSMGIVGPLIVGSILLLLLLHLKNLDSCGHGSEGTAWIGRFPDLMSRVVSISSTAVLPEVVVILATVRSGGSVVGWGVVLVVTALSGLIVKEWCRLWSPSQFLQG